MTNVYNSQLVRLVNHLDRLHNSADYGFEDAFDLYHKIQEQNGAQPSDGLGLPALGHAIAGSAGTAISHVILYPLDLVITRLQVQRQLRGPSEAPSAASEADVEYKDVLDAAQKIYSKEGGLGAFYTGCLTDTSKSVVDAFLFFLAYTFLRQRAQRKVGSSTLPVLHELSVGIAAGAFSKFITTPIQQIVTRKQTAALVAARDPTSSLPAEHAHQLSIKDIALQIREERGIQGFWAGYSASVILTLNPSLTFLFQTLLKRTLPLSKRDNPGPRLVFLIAALSKAAASTITYPVSLAKTRAQVSQQHRSSAGVEKQDPASPPDYLQKPDLETSKTTYKATKYAKKALRILFNQQLSQLAVLRSLQHIYRSEGFMALYAGLEGEVLKGFIGHGLTMLLKERIHVGVISLYYTLVNMTQRMPQDLGSVRDQAAKEMERASAAVGDAANDAYVRAKNVGGTVAEGAGNASQGVLERARNMSESVREGAGNVYQGAGTAAQDASVRVKNITETVTEGARNAISGSTVQDARERVNNVTTTVTEGTKNAIDSNDTAKNLVDGAQTAAQNAGARVNGVTTSVTEGAKNVVNGDSSLAERAGSAAQSAGERVNSITTNAGNSAGNAAQSAGERVNSASTNSGSAAQDASERVSNISETVTEGAKNAIKGDNE